MNHWLWEKNQENESKANARQRVWVIGGGGGSFNQESEAWSGLMLILFWNHFIILHTLQDNWKLPRILQTRAGVIAQNKCSTELPE